MHIALYFKLRLCLLYVAYFLGLFVSLLLAAVRHLELRLVSCFLLNEYVMLFYE